MMSATWAAGTGGGNRARESQRREEVGKERERWGKYLGHGLRLPGLVNVGDDGNVKGVLHFVEDLETLLQARPPEGFDVRAVGLVEARLEHVLDAEVVGH